MAVKLYQEEIKIKLNIFLIITGNVILTMTFVKLIMQKIENEAKSWCDEYKRYVRYLYRFSIIGAVLICLGFFVLEGIKGNNIDYYNIASSWLFKMMVVFYLVQFTTVLHILLPSISKIFKGIDYKVQENGLIKNIAMLEFFLLAIISVFNVMICGVLIQIE